MFARRLSVLSLCGALAPKFAFAAVSAALAVARPGGGQLGLAVGFTPEGQLRAGVCSAEPCSLEHATPIAVPDEAARQASGARLRVVRLGTDRKAIVVEIPDPASARTWTAVLAAPLGGSAPLVPFSGYTGLVGGTEDEREGPMLLVRDGAVYVGTQREGYDLCGRPAILSPQVLDPKTLTLKPAKVQRLDDAERAAAPVLTATVVVGAAAPPLLHALWATSAAPGFPASALTDGKADTAWAEDRSGIGRGELVVLDAPRAVALGAFEITLPSRSAPHAAAPRDVWLVTDHQIFHVNLPDAPDTDATRFDVTLPAPVSTGCVAVVLEEASSKDPDAAVAVAELGARPALGASREELIHALSGGGPEAEAAGAVLRVSGPDALVSVASAFAELDEGGRRVALDVMDDAPCKVALPVYVAALVGPYEAQRLHVRRALDRCAAEAAGAFEDALKTGAPKVRVALADELSSVAPAAAVSVLVPLLTKANAVERRAYRGAIGRAAEATPARAVALSALDDPNLPRVATVDLLRALGAELATYGDAARRAFVRLAVPTATFRTRFLLLGPAAELAKIDGSARAFLESALTTEVDPRLRAEAARILREPLAYRIELSRLLDDKVVRVREAALSALGLARAEDARDRMLYLLDHDEWPLIRVAAAHAVVALAPGKPVDEALSRRLGDESGDVRRAALRAIGARRATADAAAVRERFEDEEEQPGIRAEAAFSLGLLCDTKSLPLLTEHVHRLASPTSDEGERLLGKSALVALAVMHPSDLEARVAPLRDKNAPTALRLLAQSALHTTGRCSAPTAPTAPPMRAK